MEIVCTGTPAFTVKKKCFFRGQFNYGNWFLATIINSKDISLLLTVNYRCH